MYACVSVVVNIRVYSNKFQIKFKLDHKSLDLPNTSFKRRLNDVYKYFAHFNGFITQVQRVTQGRDGLETVAPRNVQS